MRAISQQQLGGPEVLIEVDVDRPEPRPVEVLVRVHAAGVNPADWQARANGWGGAVPRILGFDVSGVVEAVGFGVTLYRPGDEVFGMPHFPRLPGCYAEYVTAPPRHLARKPTGVEHIQTAALPQAALTAWQALVDTANLQPGQRVLIHAAAGGVGHLAVQIAKSLGAHVIGTARASKHDFLRAVGADEVIDYVQKDFAEELDGLDAVIDTVGGDYGSRSVRTLRRGGTLVSLVSTVDDELRRQAAERDIWTGFTLTEPDHAGMQAIADLVDAGKLRAEIAATLPLAEAAKAHQLGETGRTTGKLVLSVLDQ
jgi:NADPH:quinone reductase-like Zn-dependent oxidoreductase